MYGHDFTKNMPNYIKSLALDKTFEESKKDILEFSKKIHKSIVMKNLPKTLNLAWSEIEEEYLKRLEKITDRPIFPGDVKAYITTIGRCPYNPKEKTFMVSAYANIPNIVLTTGHELFHLQFHEYFFKKLEAEIGKEKTHDIKEALTTLLNIEFNDIFGVLDKGYEIHKELRRFVRDTWNKEKNFEELLIKCKRYISKDL